MIRIWIPKTTSPKIIADMLRQVPCIVFVLIAALCVACWALPQGEKYTTKFDGVNVEEILKNRRLMEVYFKCLANKIAKCPADAAELKKTIPDVLQTGCTKCSELQIRKAKIVIKHVFNHEKAWWNEIAQIYDPEHSYEKRYAKELEELKKSK